MTSLKNDWIRNNSNLTKYEMFRTFNCGIGMVLMLVVDPKFVAPILEVIKVTAVTFDKSCPLGHGSSHKVTWVQESCAFCAETLDGHPGCWMDKSCEVMGNIHARV